MPGYFFFFGAYEFSRSFFIDKQENKNDIGIMKTALCGGLGGMSFWLSVFPADVIKSRVQIDPNGPIAKMNFVNAIMHIARKEGKNNRDVYMLKLRK